ncbi:PqqD family peptide modification chaperone [Aurantiacibacter sp. MUD11]|uniref:PqqD family peptide modification chaperone n=1 Tax=Aurantiacibacter sp. MUD11 TaxID=3003265 RepID=UPI0022AA3E03|nr:PqqD family peptide modification chaperone [Aurantiacibacter sp. MUD11]WAT18945.1 PqqD family peptide modification chaperone [Aurantiacibacter sp. MUD11]
MLKIKSEDLIHENVNGEAIVLSIKTGTYYNLEGSAADIWAALEKGASISQLVELMQRRYDPVAEMQQDITDFLDRLIKENLVQEVADALPPEDLGQKASSAWQKPELVIYEDLQELLTIDPIHDVTDSGWPNAKGT